MSGLAAAGLVLALSGPAFAKGPKGPKPVRVTCTHLSGTAGGTVTISGCNQPAATGGSGTFQSAGLGKSGSATVTWNGTGTTTFSYSTTLPAKSKCGTGKTEAILHGAIRSNTETNPATDGGVKAAVTAKLCVDGSLNLSLLPPKPMKL